MKLYRLRPGCCAASNNYGDKTFPPEIGPTFTVDWSFSGPLGDVDCYRATDASGRRGFVFRDDVEEVPTLGGVAPTLGVARGERRRKGVWRVGDRGIVVDPRFVARVGYPKSQKEYLAELHADEKAVRAIDDMLLAATGAMWGGPRSMDPSSSPHRVRAQIERDVAFLRAELDGFGGRERSIHWHQWPALRGREVTVRSLRTVYTGKHKTGIREYWFAGGDCDVDQNSLEDRVAHRLAVVSPVVDKFDDMGAMSPPWEIPVAHLTVATPCLSTPGEYVFLIAEPASWRPGDPVYRLNPTTVSADHRSGPMVGRISRVINEGAVFVAIGGDP